MESSENKNPGSSDLVRGSRDLAQGSSFTARRARELAQKAGQLQSTDDIDVMFADKNLETAVREVLKKDDGPLTRRDLKRLKSFRHGTNPWHRRVIAKYGDSRFSGAGLEELELMVEDLRASSTEHFFDLTGLEYAVNLTELDLYGHPITDLLPLRTLTKLSYLKMMRCRVRDIEPISSLPELSRLDLTINPLSRSKSEIHISQLKTRGVDVYYIVVNEWCTSADWR
jgi:Leucine-rich repeat (LRR) protein